jgi:hypothetical protein
MAGRNERIQDTLALIKAFYQKKEETFALDGMSNQAISAKTGTADIEAESYL